MNNFDKYTCTPYDNLTKREIEFIKLCVSELTYAEIAVKMHLAGRSIERYGYRIFIKLNIRSRYGIIIYAIKNGLVTL